MLGLQLVLYLIYKSIWGDLNLYNVHFRIHEYGIFLHLFSFFINFSNVL